MQVLSFGKTDVKVLVISGRRQALVHVKRFGLPPFTGYQVWDFVVVYSSNRSEIGKRLRCHFANRRELMAKLEETIIKDLLGWQ